MIRDAFGCYRSLEPPAVLPQNCWKLDNTPVAAAGETLIDVEVLNVDSASFRQLQERSESEGRKVEELILEIVEERGKLHNPVTGSGGILLGTTPEGVRIATLVSLSLTPLKLGAIHRVDPATDRVYVTGKAILFEQTLFYPLPADLPEAVVLAALDVAGAPARCGPLSRKCSSVLIIGAGKAGLLVAAAIREENPRARILAVDVLSESLERMKNLDLCDWSAALDTTRPLPTFETVAGATGGALCDLTINLVNQTNTEGSSILCTRDGGVVYFFSMATNFSRAALTAEGVARDVEMLIGSGYSRGWADYTLGVLRRNPPLLEFFQGRYGQPGF